MDIDKRKDLLATVYLIGVIAAIVCLFYVAVLFPKIFLFGLLIIMVGALVFIIWKLIRALIE